MLGRLHQRVDYMAHGTYKPRYVLLGVNACDALVKCPEVLVIWRIFSPVSVLFWFDQRPHYCSSRARELEPLQGLAGEEGHRLFGVYLMVTACRSVTIDAVCDLSAEPI